MEEQFQEYLSLDEAEPYIDELITARLLEFKQEQDEEYGGNLKALGDDLTRSIQATREVAHDHFRELDAKYGARCHAQDEIVDLISGEISKDAKKKNDLILDVANVRAFAETSLKRAEDSIHDLEEELAELREGLENQMDCLEGSLQELENKMQNYRPVCSPREGSHANDGREQERSEMTQTINSSRA